MYEEFYGLHQPPFHVTPDPSCLFLSDGHKDGVGKTTSLRYCLEQLDRTRYDIIYMFQPTLAPREFYMMLYRELFRRRPPRRYGIEMEVSAMVDAIQRRVIRLVDQGKSIIVVIDEAQNVPIETLESLRMLSNLETDREKLLQIVFIGQIELEDKLARHDLRQLDQRIAVRARIPTLSMTAALHYIEYRVALAGRAMTDIFTYGALWTLVAGARGNARRLNMYCDNALMNGYGHGVRRVGRRVAREAVHQFARSKNIGALRQIAVHAIAAVSVVRYAGSRSAIGVTGGDGAESVGRTTVGELGT